jgi:hypothetical protein
MRIHRVSSITACALAACLQCGKCAFAACPRQTPHATHSFTLVRWFNVPTMARDPLQKSPTFSQSPYHHTLSSMLSFTCPQCDQRCKSLSGLKRHQISVHGDDPRLSIPVTELQKTYHPTLNGTYSPLDVGTLLILRRSALR